MAEAHWGSKVGDYMVKVRRNGVDEWVGKDVEMLPLSPQLKASFDGILDEYNPYLSPKEDVLKWCG